MKNNRTTALLMLLVFLLVVAVVIIFLTGLDRNSRTDNPYENVTVTAAPDLPEESAEPTPPPTTVPTTAPQYYPPSTATPVQTAAPVSTGAPASAGMSPRNIASAAALSCTRRSHSSSCTLRFWRNSLICGKNAASTQSPTRSPSAAALVLK